MISFGDSISTMSKTSKYLCCTLNRFSNNENVDGSLRPQKVSTYVVSEIS